MQLLTLRIKNIHSLKGVFEIPFSDGLIGNAGLFAVTGPTGAGKSTLLDAITLALYNRIPRTKEIISGQQIQEQGLIISQYQDDAFAEVDFEANGKKYRAHWSARYKKGRANVDRKHEITDLDNNEVLETKTSQVVKVIEKIIKLSYEQFVQSMILAQGQFDKLLKSPKNERNQLLEEITGAGIYRKIGARVYHKLKDYKDQLDDLQLILNNTQILSADQLETYQTYISENEPLVARLEKSTEDMKNKLKIKEDINKTTVFLAAKSEEQKQHEQNKLKIATEKNKLDEHDKIAAYRDMLSEKEAADDAQKEANEKAEIINKKLEKNKEESAIIIKTVIELTAKPSEENTVIDDIKQYRNEVLLLTEQEHSAENDVKTERELLKQIYERIDKKKYVMDSGVDIADKAKQYAQEIEIEMNQHEVKAESDVLKRKNKISEDLRYAENLLGKHDLLLMRNENIGRIKTEKEQIENSTHENQNELTEVKKKFDAKQQEEIQLKQTLEKQEKEKSFEQHRKALEPHEACPLCGSLEHPFVKDYQNLYEDGLHEKYIAAKEELDLHTRKITALETIINQNENLLLLKSAAIGDEKKKKDEVEKEMQSICLSLSWQYEDGIQQWKQHALQLQTTMEVLDQLQNKLSQKETLLEFVEHKQILDQLKNSYEEKKKKRELLYKGNQIHEECEQLILQINGLQQSHNTLLEQKNEALNKAKNSGLMIQAIEQKFQEEKQQHGLENLGDIKPLLLSENEARRIREEYNLIENAIIRVEGEISLLNKQLQQLKENDSSIHEDQLKEQLKTEEEKLEETKVQITRHKTLLSEDEIRRKQQEATKQEYETTLKETNKWKKLNELIGDSTGNKFCNYVQELTLHQLIIAANKRLQGFSKRYQLCQPDDSGNLRITDRDLGYTERNINSLSGGETFMLSLAMAFGLSDLSSRNVEIKSLFIDEGFGSLDSESLNDAISVLEDMQHTGNKTIGIISHVGELKDRISTKIKLEPIGNGCSSLEIVSD